MATTSVKAAVAAELRSLSATNSPEGRAALLLAGQLDDTGARDAAALSRELRLVLEQVRARFAVAAADPVDELREKRRRRRRAG